MARKSADMKYVRAFDMDNGVTYLGRPQAEKSFKSAKDTKGKPLDVLLLHDWVPCQTKSLVPSNTAFRDYSGSLRSFYESSAANSILGKEPFELRAAHIVASYFLR